MKGRYLLTTQEEVQIICSGACPEYDCAASYSNGGSPHQHAEQPHEGEGAGEGDGKMRALKPMLQCRCMNLHL